MAAGVISSSAFERRARRFTLITKDSSRRSSIVLIPTHFLFRDPDDSVRSTFREFSGVGENKPR